MRCRFDCGALLGVVLFATSNAVVLQVAAAAGLTKDYHWAPVICFICGP